MFQDVWRAEINRIFCKILDMLYLYYRSPEGKHWKSVRRIAASEICHDTLWINISSISKLFLNGAKGEAVDSMIDGFQDLINRKTKENILRCLMDIEGMEGDLVVPSVSIEPIETPTSTLETDASLSQLMISALLNVFETEYAPDETRVYMQVSIGIPWHRFEATKLNLPQKIIENRASIEWSKEKLQKFIAERIKWEFRRVRRHVSEKDSVSIWYSLFDKYVRNDHCDGEVNESSFEYILRHTHWRARDLLHFCRQCVLSEAERQGVDPDNVISGHRGLRVTGRTISDTLKSQGAEVSKIRNTEIQRRFGGHGDIMQALRGINVPFSTDDFFGRFRRYRNNAQYGALSEGNRVLKILWEAGVVGLQVVALTEEAYRNLETKYPVSHCKRLTGDTKTYKIGAAYFYSYNSDVDFTEMIDRYDADMDLRTEANLIVHPLFFEALDCHVSTDHPLGV
tara:strand:- start:124 stop:1488 length:1365 start_codon:yes stop_codon:yes gene_type:complete